MDGAEYESLASEDGEAVGVLDSAGGGDSVLAAAVGRSDTKGRVAFKQAGRQVLTAVAVTRAIRGARFEDLASNAVMSRRMAEDKAAAAAAATPRSRRALRQARAVPMDGGIAYSSAVFVSNGQGAESLALTIGAGNHRLVLHDSHTLLETGVAIDLESEGETILGFRKSPDLRRVCVSIGIDQNARLAVFEIDRVPPWSEQWSETKGDPVLDMDFSADGSVVACVAMGAQHVDLHNAESGSLLRSFSFGVATMVEPACAIAYTLRFSEDLLVVSGGWKTEDEKTVGVWRLDNVRVGADGDTTPLSDTITAADDTPIRLMYDSPVGPVAACTKHVCVGAADGSVNLHEIVDASDREAQQVVQDRRIRLAEPRESAGAKTAVVAVNFSHDGSMLAAAWATGEVEVFSTNSTARLARFVQNDCADVYDMLVLSFSEDDSRLAIGGGTCASVAVHQLAALRPLRFAVPGNSENLTSAAVSAEHVALACGSRVVIQLHSGEDVADIDTEDPICSGGNTSPVQLRPTGGHVAVVLSNKIIEVYSFDGVPGDNRIFRKEGLEGFLFSIRYSPDGTQLLVAAITAVYVLSAATGEELHKFNAKPDYAMVADIAVDPVSKRIICANFGGDGGLNLTDLETGTKLGSFDQDLANNHGAKFFWPCVDETDRRLAYTRLDAQGRATVVARSLDEDEGECLASFEGIEDAAPVGPKGFNGDWLLCATLEVEQTASSDVTIVDVHDPDAEVELNALLSAILGTGFTAHSSVGWVPGTDQPTVHATVGSELVFVDLQRLETMQTDGCMHAHLLMDLCGDDTGAAVYQPTVIDAIVDHFPDCINVPKRTQSGGRKQRLDWVSIGPRSHSSIGDTVLHYCARKHRTEAVRRWLPIDGSVHYTPVSSGDHDFMIGEEKQHSKAWTALHEAIARSNKDMTLHLLRTLANASNDVTAELVADAVMLMTKTMPYLVPDALKLLDTRLVRKESTIETRIHDETHLFGPNQKGAFVSGRDELIKDLRTNQGTSTRARGPDHTSAIEGALCLSRPDCAP
eukprot:COSAG06_NODE_2001_length_7869_cov_25.334363_2_plen_1036_part_00